MAEIYLVMNKPKGYVCSAASDSHKTVYELLPPELQALVKNAKRGHRLHTIGRLDADTSGLLLLTTDGMFSHRIASGVPEPVEGPCIKAQITKTYLATLKNPVNAELQKEYITKAAAGLTLPPEKKAPEQEAAPAKLHFIKEDTCKITVTEGKFHEVRRIFRALGNEVTALERTAIGAFELPQDLQPGQYRFFTPDQIVF
ncbi:MAG: pseudouridine synthase [Treponema sp.]|nr:pseudouridine synthase [Treponema sp.]